MITKPIKYKYSATQLADVILQKHGRTLSREAFNQSAFTLCPELEKHDQKKVKDYLTRSWKAYTATKLYLSLKVGGHGGDGRRESGHYHDGRAEG